MAAVGFSAAFSATRDGQEAWNRDRLAWTEIFSYELENNSNKVWQFIYFDYLSWVGLLYWGNDISKLNLPIWTISDKYFTNLLEIETAPPKIETDLLEIETVCWKKRFILTLNLDLQ